VVFPLDAYIYIYQPTFAISSISLSRYNVTEFHQQGRFIALSLYLGEQEFKIHVLCNAVTYANQFTNPKYLNWLRSGSRK